MTSLPKRGDRVRVTETGTGVHGVWARDEYTLNSDAHEAGRGYVRFTFLDRDGSARKSGAVKVEILERAEPLAERCRCFGLAPANLCPACQAYESERSGRGQSTTPVHPEFARGMRRALYLCQQLVDGDPETDWSKAEAAIEKELAK